MVLGTLALLVAGAAPGSLALPQAPQACDAVALRVVLHDLNPLGSTVVGAMAEAGPSAAATDTPRGTASGASSEPAHLLGIVTASAARSACEVGPGFAQGEAQVADLVVDLSSLGQDVLLSVEALHEDGASGPGAGNDALLLRIVLNGDELVLEDPEPNTVLEIGPVTLTLNEQSAPGPCDERSGTALHVAVADLVDVYAASVATRAC